MNNSIDSSTLKMTKKVESHFYELTKKTKVGNNGVTVQFPGESTRPYVNSNGTTSLIDEIMSAQKPVPDPGGLPNGVRWDVQGTYNSKSGVWELVIDKDTNTIVHFLFNPKK